MPRILLTATTLAALAAVLLWAVLKPATPPTERQLGYQAISGALAPLKQDIASRLATAPQSGAPLPPLIDARKAEAITQSQGLIRQLALAPDGTIAVTAALPHTVGEKSLYRMADFTLTPARDADGRVSWTCHAPVTNDVMDFCKLVN